MNSTIQTILYILLIILGFVYLIVYLQKKKNNTHKDIMYKLVYIAVFLLIVTPLFFAFK